MIGGPARFGTPAMRLAKIAQDVALENARLHKERDPEGDIILTVPTLEQFEKAMTKHLEWEFVMRLIQEFEAMKMSQKLVELHEKRIRLEAEMMHGY